MAPQDILAEVRKSPFEPFKLILADGARYDIRHPDQCMVMQKSVILGELSTGQDETIEWTININCYNVIGIERHGA